MKKSVVLILLLNICLGIVAPTIAALNDHSLEEAVVLVNIEKDIEMEEEELDETVFFFEPQLKEGKKTLSLVSHLGLIITIKTFI